MAIRITTDRRPVWPYIPRYTCLAKDCMEIGKKGRLLPCKCRYVLCREHGKEVKPELKRIREHPEHVMEG